MADAYVPSLDSNPTRTNSASWQTHKEKIINLYIKNDMTLKEVEEEMRRAHGFDATARQYQNRFNKWGVRKNLKWDEREELLRGIEVGEDAFGGGQQLRNINRRLRRHRCSRTKRELAEKSQVTDHKDSSKVQGGHLDVQSFPSDVDTSKLTPSSDIFSLISGSEAHMEHGSQEWQLASRSITSGNSANDLRWPQWLGHGDVDAFFESAAWSPQRDLPQSLSISPSLAPADGVVDLNALLTAIREFTTSQLREQETVPTEQPLASAVPVMDQSKLFWVTLKSCIYYYKLDDIRRAEPLLTQLCSTTPVVIQPPSLEFLRSLLKLFSPVNFRRHPEVRPVLLKHVSTLVERSMGFRHPISRVCREFIRDENTRYTTETALSYIHSSMVLCRSEMVFDTQRALIALLRRDKAYDDALRTAESLYLTIKTTSQPNSKEVRDAAKELAHIFMDIGNFDRAIELCMTRVGKLVARDGLVGHSYRDRRAIHALEDLAEIEAQHQQWWNSAKWLMQAAYLARDIDSPPVVMIHILDKLDRALMMCDRGDAAEIMKKEFALVIDMDEGDKTEH